MKVTHAQGSTHWHTRLGALFVALTSFVGCVLPHANPMPIDNPPVGMDADVVMGDVLGDRPNDAFDVPDPCPMNQTRCGPNCVDINRSVNDCGRCGNVCTPGSNQTSSCQLGICANICAAGFLDCNAMAMDGCEVNSAVDPMNCGGCNTRCGANSVCTAGVCQCAAGFTMCGGACINFQTNVNNCGACGTMCAARANSTVACTAGMCRYTCLGTHADCNNNLNMAPAGDGCEVPLGTAANCRMCGERCMGGSPNCAPMMGCVNGCAPLMTCAGGCVDQQINVANCGGCGNVCNAANGTAGCVAGRCTVAACNAGFANCDMNAANGCEANTNSDNANCGGCGIACGNNSTCMGGVCRCNANFGDCNNMRPDGCEARLDTLTNCNACGMACGPYAQGTATCTGAVGMARCGVNCNGGTANCDNNLANGCEVDTRTDRANCGACGTVCPNVANGTPSCVAGVCGVGSCNAGFGNCDNMAGNGCEVNLGMDIRHCNGCGMACATPANAAPTCIASACGLGGCNAGFGNCDANAMNGCETNTNTTVAHCGMCGNVCSAANGVSGCAAGACTVASCSAGFGNCDGMVANGCEARLNTNARCGACGTACMSAVAYCSAGPACTNCGAGLRDCNNDPMDACEVNISSDVNNCNACGTVCMNPNGTTLCAANACVPVCNVGFGNCDGLPNNGCETNTNTTALHCGICGNACSAPNPNCVAGACVP